MLFRSSRYSYYAQSSTVWQIIDSEGHTYIWTTSSNLSDDTRVAKEIVASVKEHKDYKGTKQTVITRGKVVSWIEENNNNENTETLNKRDSTQMSVKEAMTILSELFDAELELNKKK